MNPMVAACMDFVNDTTTLLPTGTLEAPAPGLRVAMAGGARFRVNTASTQ